MVRVIHVVLGIPALGCLLAGIAGLAMDPAQFKFPIGAIVQAVFTAIAMVFIAKPGYGTTRVWLAMIQFVYLVAMFISMYTLESLDETLKNALIGLTLISSLINIVSLPIAAWASYVNEPLQRNVRSRRVYRSTSWKNDPGLRNLDQKQRRIRIRARKMRQKPKRGRRY